MCALHAGALAQAGAGGELRRVASALNPKTLNHKPLNSAAALCFSFLQMTTEQEPRPLNPLVSKLV